MDHEATTQTGPVHVTWFQRDATDHRPGMLQLPASLWWFRHGGQDGCVQGGVAWIPVGDRVAAVAVTSPCAVLLDGPELLLVDADGTAVRVVDGLLHRWTDRGTKVGRDVQLTRGPAGWHGDVVLPDGARWAGRLAPFAQGRGVVWADQGWLYRLTEGSPPRPLGPIAADERIEVGPHGGVLVGDTAGWTRAAAPSGLMVSLPISLRPGSVRWRADGAEVAALPEDGTIETFRISLATGQVVGHTPDALPLTSRRVVEPGEGGAGHAMLAIDPVLGAPGGVAGLVGPGGRLWRLRDLADLGDAGEGPALATSWGWALPEDGRVRLVGPDGTALGSTPGFEEDPIGAWSDASTATWMLANGERVTAHRDEVASSMPPGAQPPGRWAAVGAEASVTVGGRTVSWSADGLLLSTR